MGTCEHCQHTGSDVHKRLFQGNTERMLCDDRDNCQKPLCLFEEPRNCDICVPQMKKECPNKKEGNESNLMPTV
jgi:hypothetical protein